MSGNKRAKHTVEEVYNRTSVQLVNSEPGTAHARCIHFGFRQNDNFFSHSKSTSTNKPVLSFASNWLMLPFACWKESKTIETLLRSLRFFLFSFAIHISVCLYVYRFTNKKFITTFSLGFFFDPFHLELSLKLPTHWYCFTIFINLLICVSKGNYIKSKQNELFSLSRSVLFVAPRWMKNYE